MQWKDMTMAKTMATKYEFHRSVRTANGERYYIFQPEHKPGTPGLGSLDLHLHGDTYYATLVLREHLKATKLGHLISQIEQAIIPDYGSREDFLITIWHGKVIGDYSDIITEEGRRAELSTRGDIESISSNITKVLGKHQATRGLLNEYTLVEYFSTRGYVAKRGGNKLDEKKIDVVAQKDGEILFAQAKLGTVKESHMRELIKEVSQIEIKTGSRRIAAIAGERFPRNCEFIRMGLEMEFDIPLLCIHKSQILEAIPEHRRFVAN
jgi:hypothetical protein